MKIFSLRERSGKRHSLLNAFALRLRCELSSLILIVICNGPTLRGIPVDEHEVFYCWTVFTDQMPRTVNAKFKRTVFV